MSLTNAQLSELLWRAAEEEVKDHRRTALERAARSALFRWPEEAAVVVQSGRSLTELTSVGPWLARILFGWVAGEDPPDPVEASELRRGFLTLADARSTLAAHPDWTVELRADLQMHTTYSDGRASVAEMARNCATLGYGHVNVTDHSQGLRIAGGMDEATLAAQGSEIRAVNEALEREGLGLTVLQGLEMNLSPEGEGDMDPRSLDPLALVLGAFHSKLRLTEDQTERYLRALANPTVDVLAHPRGRRFGVRTGLHADWPVVFEEAAALGVALEVDAFPDRQDLEVELLALARDAGVWISIGTDAHRPEELRFMEFGLAAVIRAGIERSRILNFLPLEGLLEWKEARRAS